MKYIKLAALIGLTSPVWAQQEMPLTNFSKIEINAPIKLQLISGKETKATFQKSSDGLSFNVDKDILHIELDGKRATSTDWIKVYYTNINQIELNGASEINMENGSTIKGEMFELEINGASNASLILDVKKIKVESNGASKITLVGKAEKAEIELAGASKLFANDLKCEKLDLDAAGASNFAVNVSADLQIDAAGASKGTYIGNPINKNINVSGFSNITDANTGESMKDDRAGNDDTTRISLGKTKLIIIDEEEDVKIEKDGEDKADQPNTKKYELKKVYAGFEMGMNQLISPELNFNLPAKYDFLDCKTEKSWFYGLNLIEEDLQLVRNHLAITTGLGMEFQNFTFNTSRILQANSNIVSADSGLVSLSNNKLYNYNFNVPLLVKFAPRTKKERNNFHIALGVIGSFKAYSHVRTETSVAGFDEETKYKDDFNINPFRLTATARIGYGWFRAFANYSLTPYFKTNNNNPDIRVFSAGITLVPFK